MLFFLLLLFFFFFYKLENLPKATPLSSARAGIQTHPIGPQSRSSSLAPPSPFLLSPAESWIMTADCTGIAVLRFSPNLKISPEGWTRRDSGVYRHHLLRRRAGGVNNRDHRRAVGVPGTSRSPWPRDGEVVTCADFYLHNWCSMG